MTKRPTRAHNTALPLTLTIAALSALNAAFAGPVGDYGRLFADGNMIVGENSRGQAVQLKGPSMQWSVTGWGSDRFFLEETVNALVDGWNAQVVRVPLGISVPDDVEDGYDITPEANWGRVRTVVDAVIAKDVYAIVDWHSHTAHLGDERERAIDFFTNPERAGRYKNNPAVIFEIYNEPTDGPSWTDDVKGYADTVIAAIRRAGFNNLILVGSPHWDTETDIAAQNPPVDSLNNFALTFHFYAAAHRIASKPSFSPPGTTYRSVVQGALDAGIPVFVSEWGTNNAMETGRSNFAETDKWHAYLDSNKISSCAWGVAASGYYGGNVLDYWSRWGNPLHFDIKDVNNWTDPFRMTPHGRYIYRWLTGKDTAAAPELSWPAFSGKASPIEMPPEAELDTIANISGASVAGVNIDEDGIMHITYNLVKGTYQWDPYVGVGIAVDGGLARCEYGIGYSYKGAGPTPHTLRAEQSNVTDDDYHVNYKPTPTVSDWTEVRIPWGYFWQEEWELVQTAIRDSSLVKSIRWYIIGPSGSSGELWVKDVQCLGDESGEQVSVKPNRAPSNHKTSAQFVRISGRTLNLRFAQKGRVDIYDLKGGKIRSMDLKQGDHAIKMNGLPKGTYIVNAQSGAWKQSVKMLIKY